MTRSTHQKKLHDMERLFGEKPSQVFFSLTPDARSKLLCIAIELQVTESFVIEAMIRADGLEDAVEFYKNNNFYNKESKKIKSVKRYGQPKNPEGKKKPGKSLSLTSTAIKALDYYAIKLTESRSEVLECAIRGGGLLKADILINSLVNSK